MLRKDELSKIAEAKHLSLPNAERDYLLEVLLFALYTKIKDELVFKGGTAMYKMYRLNRFSEDLDFTFMKHRKEISKTIQRVVEELSLLGISVKIKEIQEYRQQINVHLECKGPLYNGSKESLVFIPINISLREKVQYAGFEMLFSSYREIPSFEVYVMKEQEIVAEKVRTILSRDKARDVYDLWFLLKKGVAWDEELIEKKLKIVGIHFNKKDLLEAIAAKEKMWEMDLQKLILGSLPPFRKVQEELAILIEKGKEE
ncbi:nucleotidyl transferase AbiEii/AbiGii toxin family protein [Candidatus Woesearchaeota archaeon]|nr:nucleotidyl transferase AbiEii/AbiGii toxin family protein [Candidatus Woesearchaeota archaeon]